MFTSIVAFIISIVWCLRVVDLNWLVDVTDFISMSKSKVDVVCPTCMAGNNLGIKSALAQNTL